MTKTWTLLLCASAALAQKQELALTLGGTLTTDRTAQNATKLSLDSGVDLQANYEYRVMNAVLAKLYVGVDFLANGQRSVTSLDRTLTHDVATLYVAPNVMVKFFGGPVHPWVTAGAGAAIYEHSKLLLNGLPNPVDRNSTQGLLMVGGGVDFPFPILRFLALRAEIRDFYSGSPSFNTKVSGGQNNVVVGGGVVLRWH